MADHVDTLEELAAIGAGRAAAVLNFLLAQPVRVRVSAVREVAAGDALGLLEALGDAALVGVGQAFGGGCAAPAGLVLPSAGASRLVELVTGAHPDRDAAGPGVLAEVGGIVLGCLVESVSGVSGASGLSGVSGASGAHRDGGLPWFCEGSPAELLAELAPATAGPLVVGAARIDIGAEAFHGAVVLAAAAPLPATDGSGATWARLAVVGAEGGVAAPAGRVLLAEDDRVNRIVAERQLHSLGWAVEAVANGADAVDAVTAGPDPYDLVLMDCHMPVMDGFAATRAIRAAESGGGPRTPILAMTASDLDADRDACLAAGMDGFVPKPVRRDELAVVLAQVASARRRSVPARAASGASTQIRSSPPAPADTTEAATASGPPALPRALGCKSVS